MKYYITNKLAVANGLLDLLNKEVIENIKRKVYPVEVVDEDYQGKKYKVFTENDNFKCWIRILTDGRITDKYAELITHPDGTKYAIPIIEGLKYYDVLIKIKKVALNYGIIVDDLSPDWFPEEVL